ncbi:MAG: hypothetical protein ACRCU2_32265 [Planktothrix sp.]
MSQLGEKVEYCFKRIKGFFGVFRVKAPIIPVHVDTDVNLDIPPYIQEFLQEVSENISKTKLIDEIKIDEETLKVIESFGEALKQFGKELNENGLLGSGCNKLANELSLCIEKFRVVTEKFFAIFAKIAKIAWAKIGIAASAGSSLLGKANSKIIKFVENSRSKARMLVSNPTGIVIVAGVVVIASAGLGYYVYTKHQKKELEKKMSLKIDEECKKIEQKLHNFVLNNQLLELDNYVKSGKLATELVTIPNISLEKIAECKQDIINYFQFMMELGFEPGFKLGLENS